MHWIDTNAGMYRAFLSLACPILHNLGLPLIDDPESVSFGASPMNATILSGLNNDGSMMGIDYADCCRVLINDDASAEVRLSNGILNVFMARSFSSSTDIPLLRDRL